MRERETENLILRRSHGAVKCAHRRENTPQDDGAGKKNKPSI